VLQRFQGVVHDFEVFTFDCSSALKHLNVDNMEIVALSFDDFTPTEALVHVALEMGGRLITQLPGQLLTRFPFSEHNTRAKSSFLLQFPMLTRAAVAYNHTFISLLFRQSCHSRNPKLETQLKLVSSFAPDIVRLILEYVPSKATPIDVSLTARLSQCTKSQTDVLYLPMTQFVVAKPGWQYWPKNFDRLFYLPDDPGDSVVEMETETANPPFSFSAVLERKNCLVVQGFNIGVLRSY
jgi:hypothetical protein